MDDLQELQNAAARVVSNASNLRQQLQDTERWLEMANSDRAQAAAGCEALRQEALCAGLIEVEVCGGCGAAAPCPHHAHCGTEKRLFNKLAHNHCRERDEAVVRVTKAEADRDFWKERSKFMQQQRDMRLGELGSREAERDAALAEASGIVRRYQALRQTLSQSGHDMDTDGRCGADCPACESTRREARSETADALDHLRTCPPNMCRDGHPEIRYEQAEDMLDCPLCRALSRLAGWEKKMPCGHPEAALIVEDPPHCAVCDLVKERSALTFRAVACNLLRLQEEQKPWVEHNFPGRPNHIPLLGALEELGELSHAHIKQEQNIRGTPAELEAATHDAMADTVIYLADYCTAHGFDFQDLMEKTWDEVKKRDWKADPETGGSGELSNRQSRERYQDGTKADH